eukprot:1993422-Rhodomonas_salina.2
MRRSMLAMRTLAEAVLRTTARARGSRSSMRKCKASSSVLHSMRRGQAGGASAIQVSQHMRLRVCLSGRQRDGSVCVRRWESVVERVGGSER